MGRSVSSRRQADEKPDDQSYKQDPLYLWLRKEARRCRRIARKDIDNASRRRRRTDPDLRDKNRARRYGLTLQDYRDILQRQANACAICKTSGPRLCIDHCHATGHVRGLLCRKCNLGLGNYNDDPGLTRAATAYLEAARRRHRSRGGVLLRWYRLCAGIRSLFEDVARTFCGWRPWIGMLRRRRSRQFEA